MGYTQEELAEALHVDRSTVHRWESGRSEPQPYMQPKLAKLLGVGSRELEALIRGARARPVIRTTLRQPQLPTPASRPASLLNELRHIVIGRAPFAEEPAVPGALNQAVSRVHWHYQLADYDQTATLLPPLIAQLDNQPADEGAAARRAGGYVAAAKLATKLGAGNLAGLAADRACAAALESERAALVGVARYQVACALLRNGYLTDARSIASEAAEELARQKQTSRDCSAISARGALLLLSAVMAARQGEDTDARRHLRQARELADVLGQDGNFLWTGFGDTNVAIHELSVAVQLGDARQAHALGAALDTDRLPDVLVGRRSQVHLDLSRAAADVQDDGLAVLHLLEAERVAEQAVSRNTTAHGVIRVLLSRERRNSTPGLRALARRAGIDG
jgi:transcriptional regulator with XRE-family HTH domain